MDFEKADFGSEAAVAGPSCALCKQRLVDRYFQINQATLCPTCAARMKEGPEKKGSFGRAMKASAFGCGAGLLGAAVYAGVLYGLHLQAALITIGIGWLVGRGVMAGSGQRGGLGYQILAAVLTYVMCTEATAPSIYMSLTTGADSVPGIVAAALSFVLAPATPFIGDFDPLGLFILGIGVWQGWKTPKAPEYVVAGPFELASAAAVVVAETPAIDDASTIETTAEPVSLEPGSSLEATETPASDAPALEGGTV